MNNVLDDVLVGLGVGVSVAYAVYALGPRAVRRRLLAGAALLLGRMPALLHLRRVALRLEAAAGVTVQGACGGCGSCGPPLPPAVRSPGSEVSIPVSKIGHRG